MIRGWRLDPLWVAYYDQRRKERQMSAYIRQQIEQQQAAMFEAACEAVASQVPTSPPVAH